MREPCRGFESLSLRQDFSCHARNGRNSAILASQLDQRRCLIGRALPVLPPFSPEGNLAVRFHKPRRANAMRSQIDDKAKAGTRCPQLYFTQLLMNLPQAKMSELSDWLPDQWKIRHLARIATFSGPSTSN